MELISLDLILPKVQQREIAYKYKYNVEQQSKCYHKNRNCYCRPILGRANVAYQINGWRVRS